MADPSEPTSAEFDELEAPPTAEQIETWPTAMAVANQLGKTQQWVGQMVRSGNLHPVQSSKGRRFNPDEVEALMPSGSAIAIQNQDGTFRILSENNKSLATNNVALLQTMLGPMKALLDQQTDLNRQLFARIARLEDERAKMLEAQEKAQSTLHQRRQERFKNKREQKRLDTALKNITDALPRFFEQLFLGRDVSSLIQSLDPTLLEALTADDVPLLNDEQKQRIKAIAAKMTEQRKKANGSSATKELPPADAGATAVAKPEPKTEVVA